MPTGICGLQFLDGVIELADSFWKFNAITRLHGLALVMPLGAYPIVLVKKWIVAALVPRCHQIATAHNCDCAPKSCFKSPGECPAVFSD